MNDAHSGPEIPAGSGMMAQSSRARPTARRGSGVGRRASDLLKNRWPNCGRAIRGALSGAVAHRGSVVGPGTGNRLPQTGISGIMGEDGTRDGAFVSTFLHP